MPGPRPQAEAVRRAAEAGGGKILGENLQPTLETQETHYERQLIEKAQAGDLDAFSLLVRTYQERMVHVAYSFLGNLEDARDTAQEAFVKAYQGLKQFQGRSRFSTWLYRILVNLCKDDLRKRKNKPEKVELEIEPTAQGPAALKGLLNSELGEAIYREINKLPFSQRSVFTLRYLEGLSLEEIAEGLGLSVGAVKANLWQAGQKMKKSLQDYSPFREVAS